MEIKQKLNSEFGTAASKRRIQMSDMPIVRAIFNSYAYNREFSYMVELCQEVLERVHGFKSSNRTYDGDIIYGYPVILYGDYGPHPEAAGLRTTR